MKPACALYEKVWVATKTQKLCVQRFFFSLKERERFFLPPMMLPRIALSFSFSWRTTLFVGVGSCIALYVRA